MVSTGGSIIRSGRMLDPKTPRSDYLHKEVSDMLCSFLEVFSKVVGLMPICVITGQEKKPLLAEGLHSELEPWLGFVSGLGRLGGM